jgi:hypothetical protein
MSGGTLQGPACKSCYGKGEIPTDTGLVSCPDCGGSGSLPRPDTHVEWRLREVERTFGAGEGESAQAVRWLAFELRRARGALTEILTLSHEVAETPELVRLRFIANRALNLYDEQTGG